MLKIKRTSTLRLVVKGHASSLCDNGCNTLGQIMATIGWLSSYHFFLFYFFGTADDPSTLCLRWSLKKRCTNPQKVGSLHPDCILFVFSGLSFKNSFPTAYCMHLWLCMYASITEWLIESWVQCHVSCKEQALVITSFLSNYAATLPTRHFLQPADLQPNIHQLRRGGSKGWNETRQREAAAGNDIS